MMEARYERGVQKENENDMLSMDGMQKIISEGMNCPEVKDNTLKTKADKTACTARQKTTRIHTL